MILCYLYGRPWIKRLIIQIIQRHVDCQWRYSPGINSSELPAVRVATFQFLKIRVTSVVICYTDAGSAATSILFSQYLRYKIRENKNANIV